MADQKFPLGWFLAKCICMGNFISVSRCAHHRIDHMAHPQNDESKITKQLSGLDLWWFMDIRMDISFAVCSQHGK